MAYFSSDGAAITGWSPVMNTSAGETVAFLTQYQFDSPCAKFQEMFHKCYAAYGYPNARRFCDFEYRDWVECNSSEKGAARREAIQLERKKQFALGERERIYEEGFPKLYDCASDFFKHNPSME